jgi:hypothetical protein
LKVGLNVLISFSFIEGMAYAHLLDDSGRLLYYQALPGLFDVFFSHIAYTLGHFLINLPGE